MIVREMEASCKYNDSTGEWIVEINREVVGWIRRPIQGVFVFAPWNSDSVKLNAFALESIASYLRTMEKFASRS